MFLKPLTPPIPSTCSKLWKDVWLLICLLQTENSLQEHHLHSHAVIRHTNGTFFNMQKNWSWNRGEEILMAFQYELGVLELTMHNRETQRRGFRDSIHKFFLQLVACSLYLGEQSNICSESDIPPLFFLYVCSSSYFDFVHTPCLGTYFVHMHNG